MRNEQKRNKKQNKRCVLVAGKVVYVGKRIMDMFMVTGSTLEMLLC